MPRCARVAHVCWACRVRVPVRDDTLGGLLLRQLLHRVEGTAELERTAAGGTQQAAGQCWPQ